MGIICSIYIISEDEFKKIPKNNSNEIEDFLDRNSPLTKNENFYYFINRYDTNTAWNPTFELLSQIFDAPDDLFKKTEYEIGDKNIFFHNNLIVFNISKKLNILESTTLNDFLQKKEIRENIKSKHGYRMDSIDFPTIIEENFQTLKLAYKEASNKKHCVVLTFG
jgi:hypothetical protein